MAKFLIVLQAGKQGPEGLARASHALVYCKDFLEKGHEARLVFDGAGTEWVPELMKPEHSLHALFKEIQGQGVIDAVCDSCAGVFGAKDEARRGGFALKGEFQGHPSLARYAAEGFQILTL